LFVIHVRTRTILLAETTFSPHRRWMAQQVRNVLWECEERGVVPRFFIHDRDGCFAPEFDAVLERAGVEPIKTPFKAPNANAYAERWVRSVREECLNYLVLFGLNSLRRVIRQYRRFFNEQRPHQGIGNRVPAAGPLIYPDVAGTAPIGPVCCDEYIGGLLRSYRRAA